MIIGGKKKKKAKKKTKTAPKIAKTQVNSRLKRIQDVAKKINKALKGRGRILIGDEVEELEYEKEPTGNPAIDYVLNGGLIRSAIVQLWGPEGSSKTSTLAFIIARPQLFAQPSKTSTLAFIIANFQSRGLICALAAIEGFDKSWWRQIGVFIPYSKKELMVLPAKMREQAERYNRFYLAAGWPPLILIQHTAGDSSLQMVYDMTKTNLVNFIGVDSLGAVISSRILEDRDIDDEDERGGEARLFNRFQRFMQSAFNTYYDDDGNIDQAGKNKNRVIVAAVNQARVTFGTRSNRREKQFHPTGGQGLKHFWSQSLFFDAKEEFADTVSYDGKQRRDIHSKEFFVYGNKMRGGPPDRDARYIMHVKDHTEGGRKWAAGQIDVVTSIRQLGVMLNVIRRDGAYYNYGDHRVHGKTKFDELLWDDLDMQEEIYRAVLKAALMASAAGSIPEVD